MAETYSTLTASPCPSAAAVVRAGREHGAQRLDPGRRLERQIDEARARHLDLRDQRVGAQLCGDRLGQLARLLAGILRQHHGGVGRHVAVGGLARRLDHDARLVDPAGSTPSATSASLAARTLSSTARKDILRRWQRVLVKSRRLTQFRRRGQKPRVLDQRVAVGHAGDEIGDPARPRRLVPRSAALRPFRRHVRGLSA